MNKQVPAKPRTAPAVMNVREVAGYLHVHPTTVYRLLKQGRIPGFRIDRDWRFDVRTIDEWRLRMNTHPSSPDSGKPADKLSADKSPHSGARADV